MFKKHHIETIIKKNQLEGRYGHILTSIFTLLAADSNYFKYVFIINFYTI